MNLQGLANILINQMIITRKLIEETQEEEPEEEPTKAEFIFWVIAGIISLYMVVNGAAGTIFL